HIALVEGPRGRGQHFENAQGAAVVTQRRYQNRADSETAATGQVYAWVTLGVVTKHNLAGAHRFGGDAGVGLQTNPEVRSSSTGAGPAHDFIPGSQSDGRSGGAGQMPGAFGNRADSRLKMQFRRMDLGFVTQGHGPETGDGMCGVGDAKLAAQGQRWHTDMIGHTENLSFRHRAQQIAHEVVEFNVGDEMRSLLVAHRPAQHTGKTEQGMTPARQAIGPAVIADQFTLHAESGRLQRDKIDILESRAVHSLAKHNCRTLASSMVLMKVTR